jgi:AcrR family transcriptional regulator
MDRVRIKLKTNLADEVFPRRLSKSEIRQIQIIEKSIQLCAKGGIEALSYEKIAQACGVTRHLVIHYFPDRQDLMEHAAEYIWASLKLAILERTDRETDSLAKMSAYISANLEWTRANPDLAVFLLLFFHYASTKARFRKFSTELLKLGTERILGIIKQGMQEGAFVKIKNPELEAKGIQNAVLGLFVSSIAEDGPFDSKTMEKALVESVFKGLTSRGRS